MASIQFNSQLPAKLMQQPEFRRALLEAVEPARVNAERYARQAGGPWMPRKGGRMIRVGFEGTTIRLTNTDYAAHLIEFGSKNNPPHAVLRRGVRAAGLRFTPQ